MLWNLGLLKGGWTLEMPRSGTLDLRSVAERRLFWFLRAVLKLSSLCKAAADTAREEPSAILLLTTKQMSSLRAVSQSCHLAWVAAVVRCSCTQGRGRRPTEACLRPRRCARPTHKLRQAQAASTFPPPPSSTPDFIIFYLTPHKLFSKFNSWYNIEYIRCS